MARLIDAEKLLTHVFSVRNSKRQVIFNGIAVNDVLTAPTVDAVEVVRCRDCKHHDDTSIPEYKHCFVHDITVQSDDFCSFGERKVGVSNGG